MTHTIDVSRIKPDKKCLVDYIVKDNIPMGSRYSQLTLMPTGKEFGRPLPGQFVQIAVDGVNGVMLRRPISVNDYNDINGELRLLIARAGRGTEALCSAEIGHIYNILLPLGNTFRLDKNELSGKRVVLIGGGVGVAPLLYYARWIKTAGACVKVVLAARTASDLILLDEFSALGDVELCTDDGSKGVHGFATESITLKDSAADLWTVCGPTPMMRAVAALSQKRDIQCDVSLENMMACGLGACLCCVQKTADGHNRCVCTEGPVFNVNTLGW